MASVSVYNMEGKETGKMELNDSIFAAPVNEHLLTNAREHRKQKHALKFVAVVENLGDRKEPDMQDRVRSVLHSGKAAELYLLQHQEIIHSK